MSIENIQKKRFLETIYKMYYALGSDPSDSEISNLYGRYFARFSPGSSLNVPYEDLNSQSKIDQDTLNRIMVHIIYNVDVLYESFYDQIEELYSIVNSYNLRIESIKSKRAEIEKKVDDQLFSLRNTDGFYYSVTEAFNDLSQTDVSLTSAVVDIENRKLDIPKLNSGLFNYVGNIISKSSNVTVDVIFEGSTVKTENSSLENAFNGLNNFDWRYTFQSSTIGLCTIKITIPISAANQNISLIEGKINSIKPVDIAAIVTNPSSRSNSLSFTKSNVLDFDRFSFAFPAISTNSIELYFTKSEPDRVLTANQSVTYCYDLRIDELVISSPYYDTSATYVSLPIGLPSDQNENLIIDKVVLDVKDQVPAGSNIRYYIAQDKPGANNIYDYDWTSISPLNVRDTTNPVTINFSGTIKTSSSIIDQTSSSISSSTVSMVKIPRESSYNNPITNYYYESDSTNLGFNLYRLAKFASGIKPYETYILENVDSNQITVNIVGGEELDKASWQQVLSGSRTDIVYTSFTRTISNTQEFFTAQNIPYGSIRLETNIMAEQDLSITEAFLKDLSAQYWDVKIYLNGVDLTANEILSPGILSSNITWSFKKGQNNLIIIINKSSNNTSGTNTAFNGSISILENRSILSLNGIKCYKNYLYEVKPEDLRNYYSNKDNVFSMIQYENTYELVYRRSEEIISGSRVYYSYNTDNNVSSIRVRADLFRGSNVYTGPSINSYTVKFKH
jgi:hypothetical protein